MDVPYGTEKMVFQMNEATSQKSISPFRRTLIAAETKSNTEENRNPVTVPTGNSSLLTPHTAAAVYSPIEISEDSKTLYVVTNQDRDFLNLAEMDLASGKISYLQNEKVDVEGAKMSRNGRLIAYIVNRDGYADLAVWDVRTKKNLK